MTAIVYGLEYVVRAHYLHSRLCTWRPRVRLYRGMHADSVEPFATQLAVSEQQDRLGGSGHGIRMERYMVESILIRYLILKGSILGGYSILYIFAILALPLSLVCLIIDTVMVFLSHRKGSHLGRARRPPAGRGIAAAQKRPGGGRAVLSAYYWQDYRLGHYGGNFKLDCSRNQDTGQEYDPLWGQTGEIAKLLTMEVPEESHDEKRQVLMLLSTFMLFLFYFPAEIQGIRLFDIMHISHRGR